MKSKIIIPKLLKAGISFVLLTVPVIAPAHDLLTDKNGMTLYTFDEDVAGTSACSWHCIKIWPPVQVKEKPQAGFGAITREGGARQLTYGGKPLYYFIGDHHPGDANGDGIERTWHVITYPLVSAKR
jgi:predicted lipoprotein with Yx(FWY)xxD motif